MTRYTFPGDLFFFEGSNSGVLLGAYAEFRVWSARTGGTDLTTSMTGSDGSSPLSTNGSGDLLADGDGQRPWMMGPDGVATIFIDTGAGDRYPIYGIEAVVTALAGGGGAGGSFVEDPLDPGTFIPSDSASSGSFIEDPLDPGTVIPADAGAGLVLTAASFGAVPGVIGLTAKLQDWINAVVAAKTVGWAAAGTYDLTSALVIPQGFGWKLCGAGPEATIFRQTTANMPIFDVGATGSASVHSWEISDLQFTYNASQSIANTNAICIKFSAMGYEGRILRCNFKQGYRGISVASGVVGFWGCTLDDLTFDAGITGSAISFVDSAIAGVPNNHFVRMLVTATNMVGPIFWLKGETSKIDTIEILNANQNPQLLLIDTGCEFDIDEIKVEVGTYTANKSLVQIGLNASVRIGYLRYMLTQASGSATIICLQTDGQSGNDLPPSVYVGKLQAHMAAFDGTSKGYGVQGYSNTIIDEIQLRKVGGTSTGTWRLQDHGASDTADYLQVLGHNRQRVSANLGNADYAITHGVTGAVPSPNVLFFETVFTAQRTVDLPSNGDDLWNGLTYKIIARNGAINGANTLRIRVGSTILRTQTTDNVAMTWAYRRQSNANVDQNWKLVDVSSLA